MPDSDILNDRRTSGALSKKEMEAKLSMEQLMSLRRLESFGWTLRFLRQPLFQDPVPVVIQGNGKAVGILEADGRLNIDVDIQIRSHP